MWQKKDIAVRLYQLGVNEDEIDRLLFPRHSRSRRLLREVKGYETGHLYRDLSIGGRMKAEALIRALANVQRCLDQSVPGVSQSAHKDRPLGRYQYRGVGRDILEPEEAEAQ